MLNLTIRKAFKLSCELRERVTPAKTELGAQVHFDVYDKLGTLEEIVNGLHASIKSGFDKQLAGVQLAQKIRNRIQKANNRPLPYANNQSINDLIAQQSTLKALIDFYPESKNVVVTDVRDLTLRAETVRTTLEDKTNAYRTSTNSRLGVNGVSQEFKDSLVNERLGYRSELESVTSQLAYANITETVELADEEAEILRSFQIPV